MKYNIATLGANIRNERTRRKWSQEVLISEMSARGNSIGRNTLSKLENGEINNINFSHILTLCDIFNCDIGYLLGTYIEKAQELHICSEYTGLSDDTLKNLHNYKDRPESDFISFFLEYLLDYFNLFELLRLFKLCVEQEDGEWSICTSSYEPLGIICSLKDFLIQQSFKDFLSFASDKKARKEVYSNSEIQAEHERMTVENIAEHLSDIKRGK